MNTVRMLAVASLMLLGASAHGALINGGFEDGPGGPLVVPTGWTISESAGYHELYKDQQGLPEGTAYFYLLSGYLAQDVEIIAPGNTYTFTWWTSTIEVEGVWSRVELWDTTANQLLIASDDFSTNDTWVQGSLEWVGTSATEGHNLTIRLVANGARFNSVALTTMIPEPGSVSLVALGGLIMLSRRRMRM